MDLKIFAIAAICFLSAISSIATADDQLDVKSVYFSPNDMDHFYSSRIPCSSGDGCVKMKIKRSVVIMFSNFKQDISNIKVKVTPYLLGRGYIDLNQHGDIEIERYGGCEALFSTYSPCDHKLPAEIRYVAETREMDAERLSIMKIQIEAPVNVRGNLHLELEITRPDGTTESRDIPVRWPNGDIPRIQ